MFVKRPGVGGRATYAIVGNDGKSVKDERLDQINRDLRLGMPRDLLEARVKQLLRFLTPQKDSPLIVAANLKLVADCQLAKLRRKPMLIDPYTSERALTRVAEFFGTLAIGEASEEDLVKKLYELKDLGRRYQLVKGLNEILRFLGRKPLYNAQPPRPEEIVFISIAHFKANAPKIEDRGVQAYLGALFATGCRLGELPVAILSETEARVLSQMDRGGVKRATKNKKGRTAPVLPELASYVTAFKALGEAWALQLRLKGHRKLLDAARDHLGVRPHDLRHSYAVAWGQGGASTAEIARYIGDTVEVCERHYRNYCATPEEIALALAKYKRNKKLVGGR